MFSEVYKLMKTLSFEIIIYSPATTVYQTMLDPKGFKQWASAFHPSPFLEGSWNKQKRMCFLVKEEDGSVNGMASEILENIPNEFVSIKHQNYIQNGVEMKEGSDFSGALEEYRFLPIHNGTLLKVRADTTAQYENYFLETWPKALQNLKKYIEE